MTIDSMQYPATAWYLARRRGLHWGGSGLSHLGKTFAHVGISRDGSLFNPYAYGETAVREAIEWAMVEQCEKHQESIREGVETRQWRRQSALWQTVKAWRAGKLTAGYECRCCHKPLTDPPSIARGIGPECWEHILNHENRSLELLREKGVDRPAVLAEIAKVRADLTEHAVTIQDRHFARLAEKRRRVLEDGNEWVKANCLRTIFDEVDRTHRNRLAFLDQFEDELHGGLWRRDSLEQLRNLHLDVLLGA
jgi:hypothetical protein